jgi:pimeloyl-ACP methyl ester carboxylesterase
MRVLLLAAATLAAASAQTPAPTGQMVDVGGYRVHVHCTGQGTPTVIIAGAGFSFDWALVEPEVAKFTRVCTYDPAGTAWSDPGPGATCQERVAELHKILDRISSQQETRGPYVIAGLSFGALIARFYAHEFPKDVAGLVLVDHAFLHPVDQKPAVALRASTSGADSPPILIHQEPIVFSVEDSSAFYKLPERSRTLHRWAMSLHPVLPTFEIAEQCSTALDAAEGRPDPLGDLPLAVVSTGNDAPNYPKLQAKLLALSHNSRQLFAPLSFHSVEIDQPDVVVRAIRLVIDSARTPAK